jgi:myo-inositol 2-dehydrogenase / D-chiro-inositol 1-dehydrogenase
MTVRVAFYGAGEAARPYLDALARRPGVELCGVCDLDRRAAEQVAAGWEAPVYLSYEAMLQEAQPQALWVCVPPHLQSDVLLRAAEQRVPFFVDPPGAINHERALVYAGAVAKAGLVTAVGFPTYFTDVAREAREYLGTNPIPLALGWWLRPAREDPTTATTLLWNEACCLVDALRSFCGEVTRVHAFGGPSCALEPAGGMIVHLDLDRGTSAVLTLAAFARPEPRVQLELLGEGWSLVFAEGLASLRVDEADKTTILRRLNDHAADHAAAFLEAVESGNPAALRSGYAEALRTLTVCHAATESAREGRPVEL